MLDSALPASCSQSTYSTQASQPTHSTQAGVVCVTCTKSDGISASPALSCIHCHVMVHTGCLVTAHKNTCGVPLKNNITWLHEFINSQHLIYCCSACESTTQHINLLHPKAANST